METARALDMLQKNGNFSVIGNQIHGPWNWVYIVVMSIGKYQLFLFIF